MEPARDGAANVYGQELGELTAVLAPGEPCSSPPFGRNVSAGRRGDT
jgi:hypothetical protein